MSEIQDIEELIIKLLQSKGREINSISINSLKRTGNNRTFYLEVDKEFFFAKCFFQDKNDLRDRFSSELAFIKYAQNAAPNFTPKIIYTDSANRVAIYEYIDGKSLISNQIFENDLKNAADFINQLNNKLSLSKAISLPLASEACFSINEHLSLIQGRIEALTNINQDDDEDVLAMNLVNQINEIWINEINKIHSICRLENINMHEQLILTNRIVSPSDFGFHNCLKTEQGNLVFIDFEYAGWDDPAKMIGDFFGQIQVPVPQKYLHFFMNLIFNDFFDSTQLMKRSELLLNAYRIKWACIALNIFLPVNLNRRKFSNPELNIVQLKKEQLQKAFNILQTFKNTASVLY